MSVGTCSLIFDNSIVLIRYPVLFLSLFSSYLHKILFFSPRLTCDQVCSDVYYQTVLEVLYASLLIQTHDYGGVYAGSQGKCWKVWHSVFISAVDEDLEAVLVLWSKT